MKKSLAAIAGGLALALLAGCSSTTTASTSAEPETTELVVFAAASLKTTFTELGAAFEAAHPGTKVSFTFDGSANLLDQLAAGAPADMLATADRATMDSAISKQLVESSAVPFATNVLTLIVPPGNPAKVTGFDDSLSGTKLVVCEARVPCGAATVKLADLLGVELNPVSEESSVTGVRTKVENGQADVGVVYVTDAASSAAKVEQIAIKDTAKVTNEYLIGTTTSATKQELATEFSSFVTNDQGQQLLQAAGFGSAG